MLTALIALAAASSPVTIYVRPDHSCRMGIIGAQAETAAHMQARRIARQLKKEGKTVKVVRLQDNVRVSGHAEPAVYVRGC